MQRRAAGERSSDSSVFYGFEKTPKEMDFDEDEEEEPSAISSLKLFVETVKSQVPKMKRRFLLVHDVPPSVPHPASRGSALFLRQRFTSLSGS
ncbi:hypothetical protein EYF80_038492 [Liparis tanakae]|uniref:Uncharacterized protein n=1 Tax=Liparis tanakae TaxID=230148 RepID=A0A4Z2GCQ4_9TELE|nr:hypothetical protein EYF80_038492 [Liparis tanakae]